MNRYEKNIIGGILARRVLASDINLLPSDFSDTELGACLEILKKYEENNQHVDAELLAELLVTEKTDIAFLSEQDFILMQASASSATIVLDAVKKIKAESLKNYLLTETANVATASDKSAETLLNRLKRIVETAESEFSSAENNFVMIEDLADGMEAMYEDFHQGISYAVPTFFSQFDELLLDGFSKGDLHLILGQTGAGKSSLALNCIRNQAVNGCFVGLVSLEMSDKENVMRFQASDASIPRWKMRKGLSDYDLKRLVEHLKTFKGVPIAIDTRTQDIETLRLNVKPLVEEKDLKILYVDYLQLMNSKKVNDTRANEVQTISRELKKLAMELDIPIVALAQFNNGVMNASIFDVMNYVRESGSIKQDASTISYIQVEQSDNTNFNLPKDAKLTVLKNRNGQTFKPIEMEFKGEVFTFSEVSNEQVL